MVEALARYKFFLPDLFSRRTGPDGNRCTYDVVNQADNNYNPGANVHERVKAFLRRQKNKVLPQNREFYKPNRGRIENFFDIHPLQLLVTIRRGGTGYYAYVKDIDVMLALQIPLMYAGSRLYCEPGTNDHSKEEQLNVC